MGFGGEKNVFRLLFPFLKQKMKARGGGWEKRKTLEPVKDRVVMQFDH